MGVFEVGGKQNSVIKPCPVLRRDGSVVTLVYLGYGWMGWLEMAGGLLMPVQWFVSRSGKVTELFRNPCCLASVGGQKLCEAERELGPKQLDPLLKVSSAASPGHLEVPPSDLFGSFLGDGRTSPPDKKFGTHFRGARFMGERVQPEGGQQLYLEECLQSQERNPPIQTSRIPDIILVRSLPSTSS